MADKAKMIEFYMHNLVLTNLNIWDPNPRMGDMQLMALASWMVNEERSTRDAEGYEKRKKRTLTH